MLKLLFVLSVTALLFLVLLGLIRSKVEPQTTVRRRMESLETLTEEREPFAQPSTAQPEEKKQAGGFKQMLAALSTALTPLRLRPIIQKRLLLAGKSREWSIAEFFGSCLLGAVVMWLFALVMLHNSSYAPVQKAMLVFLLGILGWKIKKMPLARILIPCGLSSAVFGFVFGSVFGYEDMLDPVYHALGMASKPLSVMDSINTVLIVAIGIGVVLVVTAMLLNVISCLKHKKIGEAIFSNNGLVGILFYLAGVAFCVSFMNGPQVLPNSVLFSVMGVCAVLLYIKEIPIGIIDKHPDWKPDSIVDFLLQNLFELIEYVLSYFSNTVSFLRVGAFVIVHASMMMVVFTLGGDGSNIPVIIIGNIIVIALEGLLSGIQGLRLEFYEMFSRFYEGGGRAFTPAKLEQAQTNIKTKIAGKKAKKALANKD